MQPARKPKTHHDSPCPHRPLCPACVLIEMPYEAQLKEKQGVLRKAFPAYEGALKPFVASPMRLGYRNRAKLVVASHGRFGLYRRGTHKIIYIPECPIHMDRINKLAHAVMKEVFHRRVTIYDERQHKGFLRFILIRQSRKGNGLLLTLVTRTENFEKGEQFARALRRKFPGLVGVVQNVNAAPGNVVEGPTNILLAGKRYLDDEINRIPFVVSSTSFLQGNHATAGLLYKAIAEAHIWNAEDQVYDLYCGLGLTGLHLAGKVKRIVGIEESESAIDDARRNAKLNHKTNLVFFKGKAEDMLGLVHRRVGEPTAVIVNPPRAGCDERVLKFIKNSPATRVVYVSCSPTTLARDLKTLEAGKFKVTRMQGFDMYSQTDQIETLVFLER